MRENFKLRKMKVGLVSVAITMLYIMTNGEAHASEGSQSVGNSNATATDGIKVGSQPVQNNQEVSSEQTKKILLHWILLNLVIKKSQVLHYLTITFYCQSMEKVRM